MLSPKVLNASAAKVELESQLSANAQVLSLLTLLVQKYKYYMLTHADV